MMNMKLKLLLLAVALTVLSAPLVAEDKNVGYIRSVPMANPENQIYPVNIQRINGKNPMTSHRYTVDAGEATIQVSLVFEAQWAPKLRPIQDDIFSQEFKMDIEAGKTYIIGGKVNPDASKEEMEAGTFWKPNIEESDKD